ncbi:hypothetical protein PYW08_010967 [Mythimna loreyi]|uniref:Uncharacterized protein n=1 Tax=Mythimna loreyi TaxID=667449 RepID=A0ACC2Q2L7_9NEOP|nr:hypothetical protein PYW08_010967 [Mythimna loreyi]
MELPSNGKVMKLYSHGDVYYIVTVYEFEKDEKLLVSCGPLEKKLGVVYLQLGDETCSGIGCNVSKTFQPLTRSSSIVCYLKEQLKENLNTTSDTVRKEARVILRERVLPTSTSSTTTSTTGAILEPPTDENEQRNETPGSSSNLAVIAGSAACLVIICVAIAVIVIMRLRKRKDSQVLTAQGGPRNPNYESLAEPSETSIPAYPPQWDNNYAVPVDRRTDDTTYSEPCPPTDLYATPTPKHLRNNKQIPVEPTYAVLAVQQQQGKKNVFTESDDPNYSEVYANRREDCYAKVLPKNVRNQMDQENPYAYVTNEPPYANTVDPEPMYCEPGKAQGSQYANLNNSYYANSNAQEYVEPTYCEPQKRRK